MGKVIISNGSEGGVGSDDVTASRGDVLSGKTAVTTDSDDEASAGTMSNNAGWNARVVNDATKVSVPKGFHNGSGYVESWIAGLNPSAVMAGKTVGGVVGTATNDAVLDPNFLVVGYSGYDDGVKKNGQCQRLGGQTITPQPYQQVVSSAGKYMDGNVTVNPIPSNYFDINTGQMSFKDGVVASDGVFNGNKFIFANWEPGATPAYTYLQDADILVNPGVLFSGIRGGSKVTHYKSFNLTPFKTLRVFAVNWSDGQAQFNIHILGTDRRYWIKSLTPWWMELEKETYGTFTMDISDINQQAYILFYWTHKYNDGPPSNWDSRYLNKIELLP